MIEFKQYIGEKLIGEKLRFKCNCLLPIDIIGEVVDFELNNNEIIWVISSNGKIYKFGENHPNMYIEKL